MELFVIRHAEAEPRRRGVDDHRRPLTERGVRQCERAARGLDALGVQFDRLFHSPWLRAVQTAEHLALVVKGETAVSANLARAAGDDLLGELEGENVAVVGHEPWLSELVAMLVTGDSGKAAAFALKKSGVVWLSGSCRPGKMQLRAALPPRVLRRLK